MNLKRNFEKVNDLFTAQLSLHLDFIRGIAAILVLISHIRNTFFVGYDDVTNQNVIQFILFSITGIGHQAVIIFFVLSGFFISNSVLKSVMTCRFTWQNYLINRLTRLYIVLIPALLIGGIVDTIGKAYFNYHFLDYQLESRLNIQTLLINLLFLQKGIPETFGTNGPLWSLSYEFWYYILFPLSLFVLTSDISKKMKSIYTTLIIMIFALIGIKIGLYYLIWLLGFLLLVLPPLPIRRVRTKKILVIVSLMSFIFSLIVGRMSLIGVAFLDDIIVAIPFTFFLYCLIHCMDSTHYSSKLVCYYNQTAKIISGFSYTLYLIHYPIIMFMFAVHCSWGGERMQPSMKLYLISIVFSMWLMILAYFISLVTEEKTDVVKEWMRTILK